MRINESKTVGIEPYIIECICLRLKEKEALTYLKDRGIKISPATFYRLKNEVKDTTNTRLNLIASEEFLSQHITRIDTLKTIESELFANYHLEKNPSKKCTILMQIAEIQQYLSSYYDSTRYVMQESAKMKKGNKKQEELNNN